MQADSTGYAVRETNLDPLKFDVTATCTTGYIGTPSAVPCTADVQPYSLKGCKLDTRTCKAPVSTIGYSVGEHDLVVSTFNVSAKCAQDYIGTATVTECTADKGFYSLSGCVPKKFCRAPADTTGYKVAESQLLIAYFDVKASCAPGYLGTAAVSPCGENDKPYIVAGCELDTNPCSAPSNTLGYTVHEHDLIRGTFDVRAACSEFGSSNMQVAALHNHQGSKCILVTHQLRRGHGNMLDCSVR